MLAEPRAEDLLVTDRVYRCDNQIGIRNLLRVDVALRNLVLPHGPLTRLDVHIVLKKRVLGGVSREIDCRYKILDLEGEGFAPGKIQGASHAPDDPDENPPAHVLLNDI